MQPPEIPEENPEAVREQLDDGLKSCRSVVSTYRSLLGPQGDEPVEQAGFSETDELQEDSAS